MVKRILCSLWLLAGLPAFATPGCAAQLKTAQGISRLGYSIQVGAFAQVANAERLTAKLQSRGIEAFYFRKDTGVYAVRFGDFPSREEARRTARTRIFPQQQPAEKQPRRPKAAPSDTVGSARSASRANSMPSLVAYQSATTEAAARPP